MWILLIGWLTFCAFTLFLYHCWLVQKSKEVWRRSNGDLELPRGAEIGWRNKLDGGGGGGMVVVGATAWNGQQHNGATRRGETIPNNNPGESRRQNGEESENQHRPPFVKFPSIGQGPVRFTVPSNRGGRDHQSDASTSAAQQGMDAQSNAALTTFFCQLLSNLGVNLTNGSVYIFAEHDHDIVWLHLGRGANDGLLAIHPHNLDDNVTELLEKFTELFITEGLLPYELENMPQVVVCAEIVGRQMNCNICLGQFSEGEHMTELPSCHHSYHGDCIHAWLLNRNTCPTCRVAVFFDDPNEAVGKKGSDGGGHVFLEIEPRTSRAVTKRVAQIQQQNTGGRHEEEGKRNKKDEEGDEQEEEEPMLLSR